MPARARAGFSWAGIFGPHTRRECPDGAGETLGLLEMDGYYTNDVLAYENLAGLPNVPMTNVLVNGFSGSPGKANAEVVSGH